MDSFESMLIVIHGNCITLLNDRADIYHTCYIHFYITFIAVIIVHINVIVFFIWI
jgi:hypothetical protein